MQEGKVDGMTFDGAGGCTGMSPVNMMNGGSIPTPYLDILVIRCLNMIKKITSTLTNPTFAFAAVIISESQVFKALAMDVPHVKCKAMARAQTTILFLLFTLNFIRK